MDDADFAGERMVFEESLPKRRMPELPRTGLCHNCDAPVEHLFCDSECREDHEKRVRHRANPLLDALTIY